MACALFVFPLVGRIGNLVPADLLPVAFSLVVCMCVLLPSTSVHLLAPGARARVAKGSAAATALLLLLVVARRPFDVDHPKRLYMIHVVRRWHGGTGGGGGGVERQDAGLWSLVMDYRNTKDWAALPDGDAVAFGVHGSRPSGCAGNSLMCDLPWSVGSFAARAARAAPCVLRAL